MTAAFERTHKSFDLRALRRDWPLLEARPVKVDELVERRKRQPMRTSFGRCGVTRWLYRRDKKPFIIVH